MKEGKLRIGNKGKENAVHIPFQAPDTIEEFYAQFGENEGFLMRMAIRGLRIHVQAEARQLVTDGLKAGKDKAVIVNEVLDHLNGVDLTEQKERKAPTPRAKPKVTADTFEGVEGSVRDKLIAQLRAQGVTIEGMDEAAVPA